MQKFRMLKTVKGVHDGHLHPVDFVEGTTHEIGEDLAGQFIELGAVEMADDEGDAPDSEEKSEGDAPANKAKKAAPENKTKK